MVVVEGSPQWLNLLCPYQNPEHHYLHYYYKNCQIQSTSGTILIQKLSPLNMARNPRCRNKARGRGGAIGHREITVSLTSHHGSRWLLMSVASSQAKKTGRNSQNIAQKCPNIHQHVTSLVWWTSIDICEVLGANIIVVWKKNLLTCCNYNNYSPPANIIWMLKTLKTCYCKYKISKQTCQMHSSTVIS